MDPHLEQVSLHLEKFKDACSRKHYSTCRQVLSSLKDIIDEKEGQEGLHLPQTHDVIEEHEHIEEPDYINNNEQQQQQIGEKLEDDNQKLLVGGELEDNNQLAENNHQQLNGLNNLQPQLFGEENELEDHEDFSKLTLDIAYLNSNPWGEFSTLETVEDIDWLPDMDYIFQNLGGANNQQQLGGANNQQQLGGANNQQQQQIDGANNQQNNGEPLRRSERIRTPTKRMLRSWEQHDSEEEEE